ncbi:MAG TPA: alkaline phosphatase family protein [Solirubrobacterales bacterium]|nr:alkaline phosphatase family protein [Solirubrobacterales bacterium]
MSKPSNDQGAGGTRGERCAGCGAALSASQRYCLECGARRGPLPGLAAKRIDALKGRGRHDEAKAKASAAAASTAVAAAAAEAEEEKAGYWRFMPSPQIAAVAVMALLAAGVMIGSVTSPLAESAGFAPIILEMASPHVGASAPEPEEAVASSGTGATSTPVAAASAAPEVLAPVPPEALPTEPEPEPSPLAPEPLPEESPLPEVKHVFLIVLDGHGYEEAFGKASTAPYFAKALAAQGELLSNYYAVTQGALANEIALLSGQGPTPQTALGCPESTPIAPATVGLEGQVEGSGCVYPAETPTLPGQLIENKMTWKAYVEDRAEGCVESPVRDPLLYFAALAESPECAERDVGLDQLDADLKVSKKTPTLSYIVANACHDGSETPCAPEQPAGLAGAQGFLETVVPKITASPAYKEGGLIAITFDQAPQEGPNADASSCCATPEYPNLPAPATPPPAATGAVKPSGGGGRVGLLLISPFVKAGSVEESGYYNHFSLLLSLEELLGLPPLGYATGAALAPFGETVYNAETSESSSSRLSREGSAGR